MIVRFVESGGQETNAEPRAGEVTLLDLAQRAGLPLEGTCEGQMACSTCHVVIADADVFAGLPRASEDEEDMLDLAAGVRRTSRLACQLRLADLPDGIEVRIPADAHDVQRF